MQFLKWPLEASAFTVLWVLFTAVLMKYLTNNKPCCVVGCYWAHKYVCVCTAPAKGCTCTNPTPYCKVKASKQEPTNQTKLKCEKITLNNWTVTKAKHLKFRRVWWITDRNQDARIQTRSETKVFNVRIKADIVDRNWSRNGGGGSTLNWAEFASVDQTAGHTRTHT